MNLCLLNYQDGDVELEFVLQTEVAEPGGGNYEQEEEEEIDEAEQRLHNRIMRLISGGEF
jgi:hypothetical protein